MWIQLLCIAYHIEMIFGLLVLLWSANANSDSNIYNLLIGKTVHIQSWQ